MKQKSSENDQLTGHFQSFFYISRTNSKACKVYQKSVLNFLILHKVFLKICTGQ